MVFYKVYIGYIGGTPYSVRSSIRYSIGYSILCKKRNETINIRKTMYLNDLHTFLPSLLFLRQYEKIRKTYIDYFTCST